MEWGKERVLIKSTSLELIGLSLKHTTCCMILSKVFPLPCLSLAICENMTITIPTSCGCCKISGEVIHTEFLEECTGQVLNKKWGRKEEEEELNDTYLHFVLLITEPFFQVLQQQWLLTDLTVIATCTGPRPGQSKYSYTPGLQILPNFIPVFLSYMNQPVLSSA